MGFEEMIEKLDPQGSMLVTSGMLELVSVVGGRDGVIGDPFVISDSFPKTSATTMVMGPAVMGLIQ